MKNILHHAKDAFHARSAERRRWGVREEFVREQVLGRIGEDPFRARYLAEIELLKAAGNKSPSVGIIAEERVRLRALCVAGCALPAAGIKLPQLYEMGFKITGRSVGPLHIVGFPEGWTIESNEASGALVNDTEGIPRLDVRFRYSVQNDDVRGARTDIITPVESPMYDYPA